MDTNDEGALDALRPRLPDQCGGIAAVGDQLAALQGDPLPYILCSVLHYPIHFTGAIDSRQMRSTNIRNVFSGSNCLSSGKPLYPSSLCLSYATDGGKATVQFLVYSARFKRNDRPNNFPLPHHGKTG